MATGIIAVALNRDAPTTPWGFRLHGGKDIGFPLVIQRVVFQTFTVAVKVNIANRLLSIANDCLIDLDIQICPT
ncbi:hypothetical protein JTE90_028018 [Oedothorax gibbosus]|uniref:Uncharacterized protein n=1 Tax=Oedothorax gibbosus TaxID=931172 RepID=A0AAV6VDF5_9ARAC|nr:hypothetical protein JTE90_028018 [Oedothorax gibbosus]